MYVQYHDIWHKQECMHLKEEKKLYKQNIQSNNERVRERRRKINLRVKKERKKERDWEYLLRTTDFKYYRLSF